MKLLSFEESFSFRYLSDYINTVDESIEKLKILKLLDNALCKETYRKEFLLKRGDILFFPGHMLHGVSSHKHDNIRKTLSCNFWIKQIAPKLL